MKLLIALAAMGVLFVARLWYLFLAAFVGTIIYCVGYGTVMAILEYVKEAI